MLYLANKRALCKVLVGNIIASRRLSGTRAASSVPSGLRRCVVGVLMGIETRLQVWERCEHMLQWPRSEGDERLYMLEKHLTRDIQTKEGLSSSLSISFVLSSSRKR